jgi:hypothetical protein
MKKEQGTPPQYWFWRDTKMESLSLDFRKMNIPVWISYKMAKDQDTHELSFDHPRWHEDTSGHFASVWLNSFMVDRDRLTTVMKCRPRNALFGNTYPNITANLLLALCLGLENDLGDRVAVPDEIRERIPTPEPLEEPSEEEEEEDKSKAR